MDTDNRGSQLPLGPLSWCMDAWTLGIELTPSSLDFFR